MQCCIVGVFQLISCIPVPVTCLEHILLACAMSVAGVFDTAVNHLYCTCCHVSRAYLCSLPFSLVWHIALGKSTIAALTERFYDIDQGEILIDNHPIKSLDPSWLRGSVIGFIKQEPVLFATTVMENIRYGRPSATDNEVRVLVCLCTCVCMCVLVYVCVHVCACVCLCEVCVCVFACMHVCMCLCVHACVCCVRPWLVSQ